MKRLILTIQIFLLVGICYSKKVQHTNAEIITAINNAAVYACDVLLDENGKSRCDYHMIQGKWFDYEPPWHTGQIIFALTQAYELTKNEHYLSAATKAGDWWTSLHITDHPKLNGMLKAIHGDQIPVIVFATISDGSAGLFRLTRLTNNNKYADVATSAGDWMKRNMYVPEKKVFYDNVDPKTGEVMKEWSPFWPDKEKQELFDVARPNNEGSIFKDMYEHTGETKYKDMFIELCESLLKYQDEYGLWMDFMPNEKESGYFHPRFNLWYAESLLEGYEMTKDKRYLNAVLKTGRFYTKFQLPDGTFHYKNYVSGKINRRSICGSTVAFAGMIWLRLLEYGVGDEFKENIEKSVHWLLQNQYSSTHPDKNLAGGFFETRIRFINDQVWIVNRDIATSFGIRFLCDYLNYQENK